MSNKVAGSITAPQAMVNLFRNFMFVHLSKRNSSRSAAIAMPRANASKNMEIYDLFDARPRYCAEFRNIPEAGYAAALL
jgi:hypothetical protein